MKPFYMPFCLVVMSCLTDCSGGGASSFSGPKADMTVAYPATRFMTDSHHKSEEGVVPLLHEPDRMRDDATQRGPMMEGGMGGSQSVDVTPHPATPDTQVTYGSNH